jgi:prolipoprotein diacylglyceryltransferase
MGQVLCFLMIIVGVCLLGWRFRRHPSEAH